LVEEAIWREEVHDNRLVVKRDAGPCRVHWSGQRQRPCALNTRV
jgi:hypothetical protein